MSNKNYEIVSYLAFNETAPRLSPSVPNDVDESNIATISFTKGNKLHRLDGPALITRVSPGSQPQEKYFIEGIFYSKSSYEKKVPQLELYDWTKYNLGLE